MSAIEWTGRTWNPTLGCSVASPGCDNCYAAKLAHRGLSEAHRGLTVLGPDGVEWTGEVRTHPERLDVPLRVRKPTTWFVDSMSDLFHRDVPDEFVVEVLAVMALTPHHTYQVLTKRPQRMAALLSDPSLPGRVARAVDRIAVRRDIAAMGDERMAEIKGYPGYVVTDKGRVLLEGGSDTCIWCGDPIPADRIARARFCSQRCNSKAHYEKSQGRWSEPITFRALRPDAGEQGHLRVSMVGSDGEARRELIHRLVLTAFRAEPEPGQQACHRDGDPSNNALPNLRWGSQSENWDDRRRHGNGRSHAELTLQDVEEIKARSKAGLSAARIGTRYGISDTQARNILRGDQWAERSDWPFVNLWAGASIENDRYAFRADHVRATPAAVRFLSVEPMLGPVPSLDLTGIDWVIIGGESGPGARPMDLDWAGDLMAAAQEAGTAVFVKQVGSVLARRLGYQDGKGGDLTEWPAWLRVREMPQVQS